MKTYLKDVERDDMIRLCGHIGGCEDMLEGWGGRGHLTKEEKTYLKYTVTYGKKLFKSIMGRLSLEQQKLILRRADEHLKKPEKSDVIVPAEQWEKIVEGLLMSQCSPCKNNHQRKCPIRIAFRDLGVPPFREGINTKKGCCQYEQDV